MERRESPRFGLHALVDFEWRDSEGVSHRERGHTRDISSKGMFIYSLSEPPAKADVQVEVSFRSVAETYMNLRLRATALVLRVEPETRRGAPHGFALLNRSCKLYDGVAPIED
jgi:hypothetical protein